jgi:hypothetical protein
VPTPDRLEEIQRELDRLAAQVARLQQEIRETQPPRAAEPAGTPVRANPSHPPQPTPAVPAASGDPDHALRQFADVPADPNLAKRGCLAAFIGIMAGLGAVVGAIYYVFYR